MTDVDDAEDLPEFEDWCHRRAKDIPYFQYWTTVLELEMLVLVYVRSLRQASFAMYLAALVELVPWFHGCPRPHTLCQVDPCSPEGHGSTPNEAPRCSHGV